MDILTTNIGILEGEEGEKTTEDILEEIMDEKFLKLKKKKKNASHYR